MTITPRPALYRFRRASAAVEFAVVAPFLVLLLLGIWEVGRLVQVQQLTNNAVREAGRQASTGQRSLTEVEQAALNYLTRAGINTAGAKVTITNVTASSRPDPKDATQMDRFKITLTLPFDNVRWVLIDQVTNIRELTATADWFSMKDLPLTVSTTMPIE